MSVYIKCHLHSGKIILSCYVAFILPFKYIKILYIQVTLDLIENDWAIFNLWFDHNFLVVCLVNWSFNGREAGGDLALPELSECFQVNVLG